MGSRGELWIAGPVVDKVGSPRFSACEHGRVSIHKANPWHELIQWWRIFRGERKRRPPNAGVEEILAHATTEDEVREAVRAHNESAAQTVLRSRYAGRPPMPLLQVDDVLAEWRARRQDP
jgi:hypothetical protein